MESQPQNPEFRNNPEIFHPWMSFFFSNISIAIPLHYKSHLQCWVSVFF